MNFAWDAYSAFQKIIWVEERIAQLGDGVKGLQADVSQHPERLAKGNSSC